MIKGIYRGKNLAPTATFTNAQTDSKTFFRPWLQLRKNSTNVATNTFSDIDSAGTYSFGFTVSEDIDEIRLIHNGTVRNLYPVDVFGTFALGDYVLSAVITGANPSVANGLTFENIMLNAGSQPLPYEPYGDIPKDITRIAMKGKNLFDKNSDTINNNGQSRPGVMVQPGTYSIDNTTDRAVYYRVGYGGTTTQINAGRKAENIIASDDLYVWRDNGVRQDGVMLNLGSTPLPYEPYGMQQGWEVRDQQGTILWGADKTLTGTDSISFKGYALPLKSYEIEANMEQAATQVYTIEGTSSIDYQSDGTAIALQIVGNETQSGTPTPTVPIQPEECGEKTGNLWDAVIEQGSFHIIDGTTQDSTTRVRSQYMDHAIPAGTYTISATGPHYVVVYAYTTNNASGYDTDESVTSWKSLPYTFTTTKPLYLRFGFRKYGDSDTIVPSDVSNIMLNLGQTALPYEPYGYKIPFSNGNTTYNVYLSEPLRKIGDYGDSVSSDGTVVRRIYKKIFTGNETIAAYDPGYERFYTTISDMKSEGVRLTPLFSTHYQCVSDGRSIGNVPNNSIYTGGGVDSQRLFIKTEDFTDRDIFKAYLAAQYAAGTPVCVWYVLATPTTEQTTFPAITPAQGANTLSVSTTLAPSKTRLTATSAVWPKNPIEPEEFGEKTGNLMSTSEWTNSNTDTKSFFQLSITLYSGSTSFGERRLDINENGHFSLTSATPTGTADKLNIKHNGSTRDLTIANLTGNFAEDTPLTISFDVTGHDPTTSGGISISNIMVNEGSTALPYEPYGKYKIPITNSGQTYNIFLNEPLRKIGTYADKVRSDGVVERKDKKLAFDGTETVNIWNLQSETLQRFFINVSSSDASQYQNNGLCSHFRVTNTNSAESTRFSLDGNNRYTQVIFIIERSRLSTVDAAGFQAWLASEYSAGHPVEVWYVLNTPTTESITAPEIATIQGANTLAIGTTLTPSKTSITGHIKAITT